MGSNPRPLTTGGSRAPSAVKPPEAWATRDLEPKWLDPKWLGAERLAHKNGLGRPGRLGACAPIGADPGPKSPAQRRKQAATAQPEQPAQRPSWRPQKGRDRQRQQWASIPRPPLSEARGFINKKSRRPIYTRFSPPQHAQTIVLRAGEQDVSNGAQARYLPRDGVSDADGAMLLPNWSTELLNLNLNQAVKPRKPTWATHTHTHKHCGTTKCCGGFHGRQTAKCERNLAMK